MHDCDEDAGPPGHRISCAITGHRWLAYRCWDGENWRSARCCVSCDWHNLNRFGEWVGFNPRRLVAPVG